MREDSGVWTVLRLEFLQCIYMCTFVAIPGMTYHLTSFSAFYVAAECQLPIAMENGNIRFS